MVVSSSPTVLKRWIALELRRLREAAGLSRQRVADRLHCALSHVTHLEIARNLPRAAELEVMLAFYGAADRTEFFIDMLTAARKGKDWWTAYQSAVREDLELLFGFESSAIRIESYDSLIVPGLFQTPDYTEAIVRRSRPDLSEDEVLARVEFRQARQRVLDRTEPPVLVWSVLDESVLRRAVGGPAVAVAQLIRLVELTRRPNVKIQVLPLATGTHPGIEGTFTILSFPPEMVGDPGVGYVETRLQAIYYEKPDEVAVYRDALTRLHDQALVPAESRLLLERIVEELRP